jgi:hypothetical protein
VDVSYFSEELVKPLSYKYPIPPLVFHSLRRPQAASILFVRFCECFGVVERGTLEVSLHEGNARLPTFLLRRYAARLLFCIANCSC